MAGAEFDGFPAGGELARVFAENIFDGTGSRSTAEGGDVPHHIRLMQRRQCVSRNDRARGEGVEGRGFPRVPQGPAAHVHGLGGGVGEAEVLVILFGTGRGQRIGGKDGGLRQAGGRGGHQLIGTRRAVGGVGVVTVGDEPRVDAAARVVAGGRGDSGWQRQHAGTDGFQAGLDDGGVVGRADRAEDVIGEVPNAAGHHLPELRVVEAGFEEHAPLVGAARIAIVGLRGLPGVGDGDVVADTESEILVPWEQPPFAAVVAVAVKIEVLAVHVAFAG